MASSIYDDLHSIIVSYLGRNDQLAYRAVSHAMLHQCSPLAIDVVMMPITETDNFIDLIRHDLSTFPMYTRSLSIVGEGMGGTKLETNSLIRVLDHLTNINALRFSHVNWPQLLLSPTLECIDTLEIAMSSFETKLHFLTTRTMFLNLRSLTCRAISGWNGRRDSDNTQITLPFLTDLTLAQLRLFPEELCTLFRTQVNMPNVETFYLKNETGMVSSIVDTLQHLESQPTLHRLRIEVDAQSLQGEQALV